MLAIPINELALVFRIAAYLSEKAGQPIRKIDQEDTAACFIAQHLSRSFGFDAEHADRRHLNVPAPYHNAVIEYLAPWHLDGIVFNLLRENQLSLEQQLLVDVSSTTLYLLQPKQY